MHKLFNICTFVLVSALLFQATPVQGVMTEEENQYIQQEINRYPSLDDPRHPDQWTPEQRWDYYQGHGPFGDH